MASDAICMVCSQRTATPFHVFSLRKTNYNVGLCSQECLARRPKLDTPTDFEAFCHLHRAGQYLQTMFHTFCQKTFHTTYKDDLTSRNANGKINIYESRQRDSNQYMQEYKPIQGFSDEENAAVFTLNSCWMPAAMFKPMIDALVGDIVSSIELATVHFKHDKQYMILHSNSWGPLRSSLGHNVILITLKSGEKYVLDLTGSQFNQHKPILRFADYEREYVRSHDSTVKISPDLKPHFIGPRQRVVRAQYAVAEAICERFTRHKGEVLKAVQESEEYEFAAFLAGEKKMLETFLDCWIADQGGYDEFLMVV